jgi:hypothetical protein
VSNQTRPALASYGPCSIVSSHCLVLFPGNLKDPEEKLQNKGGRCLGKTTKARPDFLHSIQLLHSQGMMAETTPGATAVFCGPMVMQVNSLDPCSWNSPTQLSHLMDFGSLWSREWFQNVLTGNGSLVLSALDHVLLFEEKQELMIIRKHYNPMI